MEHWSHSKIEATKGCKLAFEKRYIEQAPADTEIPEFESAKEIHEKIQQDFMDGKANYEALNEYLKGAEIETEKEYRLTIDDYEFIGFADLVIERPDLRVIIDIKCRYSSDINEKDALQLNAYATMANLESRKPTLVGILATFNNYQPISLVEVSTDLDIRAEIEKAKKRIKRMQVKTSSCDMCEYRGACEMGQKCVNELNIDEIAEKYLYIEALSKKYEAMLKKHLELTGDHIVIGDKKIGFFERVNLIIDPVEFITLCQQEGIDYIEALKIDTIKAKKLAKQNEKISQVVGQKISFSFGTKKV
jgi:CRISPR/Cas system-associated exonuclease Cas4 (RecB family)